MALRGAFCHGGHVCLVLQRLVPSLLDYVVDAAALAPSARLAHLRALALQLLVRPASVFERLQAPAVRVLPMLVMLGVLDLVTRARRMSSTADQLLQQPVPRPKGVWSHMRQVLHARPL